jgi:hypothetical protein
VGGRVRIKYVHSGQDPSRLLHPSIITVLYCTYRPPHNPDPSADGQNDCLDDTNDLDLNHYFIHHPTHIESNT